jgi:ribosomal protein S18 acetylase RimI-like enzyme
MKSNIKESQMGLEILKTDTENQDFVLLAKLLDQDLEERNGALQKQYTQHNKVDKIDAVIIYLDQIPVACGALKKRDDLTAEIKRVFVKKEHRGQGLSKILMNQLETLAKDSGYRETVLETGLKQTEALHLYKSIGYGITENYEPYVGNPNSVCMKKRL